MFSDRTEWTLKLNSFTQKLEALRGGGGPVIDLTRSNPTECGLKYPTADILTALAHPDNIQYHPLAKGSIRAREAVAGYYKEKGITVSPEQIFLTASTSEGYSFLFRLLANPGDRILFPQPSYPLFQFLCDLNDVQMEYYRLSYHQSWSIDFNSIPSVNEPPVRALVLVNPNNPTGSFVHPSEMARLNEISRKFLCPIISDEVFLDYAWTDKARLTSLAGNRESLSFTLGGVSKILGLPQMKLSWIVINGPADLVREAAGRLEIIADTYLSVNTPAQNALPVWFKQQPAIRQMILTRVKKNHDHLAAMTAAGPVRMLQAQGGWYALLQLPENIDEEALVLALLEQDRVIVHPGYFFDFERGAHVVVSLLPMSDEFTAGVEKILRRVTGLIA